MNRTVIALCASILSGLAGAAFAQAEHDTHHPATPPAQAEQVPAPTPPTGHMPHMQGMTGMQGMMPEQCRAIMQAMTPECMGAMQQMMQGGMMATPHAEAAPANESLPDFTRANIEAMDAMHGALLRKWPDGRSSPFPGQPYATASVTGVPRAV
ncbi:hypothetical protein ruthe_03050 [Rubellimicrobium thermophilum DSM 16684]|uniref:Uncharacterized protein n=1 Tax=Rubellimicrobium thermophilum DSM 16684 TaxID=1123069 RepID=S9S9G7_9RHOB|nr:hypothetical protein [Rubellimicrobium thermophilum]EPX82909.1 hypothetical protein ruthe_03050 [Rubellimicrobium thermophilum DSM 16684]